MFLEKMRDRKIRQAFKTHPRYYRLDTKFKYAEPRLDNAKSIPELKSKVQADHSISKKLDSIVYCMVASLFYFELDSIPEMFDGKSVGTGYIQCSLRRNSSFLGTDGNFRKPVELNVTDGFTISLK
jgi:hypothetical protein